MTTMIELPTMLNYRRSIEQGRGLMFACSDDQGAGKQPIIVEERGVRATKAYDVHGQKDKKGSVEDHLAKALQPNPQRTECAFMPEDKPFLMVDFDVKYLPQSLAPHMANNLEIHRLLLALTKGYAAKGGYDFLGQKYVVPLACGRWMWRNNETATSKRIIVEVNTHSLQEKFEFTPSYNTFTLEQMSPEDQVKAKKLGTLIGKALSRTGLPLHTRVTAFYEMGRGMQAYPSQEMLMDKPDNAPSRLLYKVNDICRNQGAFHEQKLGNALRIIDEWHGHEDFGVQAVEPLGVVSTHQISTRVAEKRDFYSLMRSLLPTWVQELSSSKSLEEVTSVDDLHYVIAVLIRGGAFV
ncbi:CRISPR-associated protein Csy3 [Pseudomonas nitritireducens]|uniref:CRISPR-associated protein Csy3 n=1 Tax=Pseudomonas nitroreducens TaxID=46680 RepID=A0A7W7P1X8_PSENT|nr:type I-F CRISPR-associated protein Csy3 [Pseudomonas nitritireducens]MBB4865313.1 CRISPR-associated protein Csy3 [Pseudomonas nitritireducens]